MKLKTLFANDLNYTKMKATRKIVLLFSLFLFRVASSAKKSEVSSSLTAVTPMLVRLGYELPLPFSIRRWKKVSDTNILAGHTATIPLTGLHG